VDGHRRSVRPTQRAAHGGVLTGRAAARAARREPRHRARHRLHTHSPLPPAPPLAATPGCPSHARPHVAVAPAEVPRFEAGVAQHTRQVGGQQPRAGPLGGVDNVGGHGALVPLVKEPDRRPQPGIRVVPTPNADSAAAARQSCRPVRPSAGRTPPRSAQRPPANRQAAVHRRAGTPQRARPSTPTPTAGGRAHGNPRSANRACAAAVAAAAGPSAQVRRRARVRLVRELVAPVDSDAGPRGLGEIGSVGGLHPPFSWSNPASAEGCSTTTRRPTQPLAARRLSPPGRPCARDRTAPSDRHTAGPRRRHSGGEQDPRTSRDPGLPG
jgi:hypothetical protein